MAGRVRCASCRCENWRKREVSKPSLGRGTHRGSRTIQGGGFGGGGGAEMRSHQRLAAFQATFSLALPGRLFSNAALNEGVGGGGRGLTNERAPLLSGPAGGSGRVLQERSSFLAEMGFTSDLCQGDFSLTEIVQGARKGGPQHLTRGVPSVNCSAGRQLSPAK